MAEEYNMMKPMMVIMMMAIMTAIIVPLVAPPAPPVPPAPTGYGCPYCTSIFDSMGELVTHIAEAHPDEPPFVEVDMEWM